MLVHDGNVIVESSVICTYLDDVFPDQPLMPKSPVERATTKLWCKLPDDILHTACETLRHSVRLDSFVHGGAWFDPGFGPDR